MRHRINLTNATLSSTPIEFSPVTERHDAVAIIASGPSYKEFNWKRLMPHVHIIAVKGAIDGIQGRANSWFTVDANRRVRQDYMGERCRVVGVHYYAAVPEDYGMHDAQRRWHRPEREKDMQYLRRIAGEGLSEDPSVIHTGNSAWGALGLAYHMQASKIVLVGVDGTQERYGVGQGSPRGDLSHLPELFLTAMRQINARGGAVRNAGNLTSLPKEGAGVLIKWLNDA